MQTIYFLITIKNVLWFKIYPFSFDVIPMKKKIDMCMDKDYIYVTKTEAIHEGLQISANDPDLVSDQMLKKPRKFKYRYKLRWLFFELSFHRYEKTNWGKKFPNRTRKRRIILL